MRAIALLVIPGLVLAGCAGEPEPAAELASAPAPEEEVIVMRVGESRDFQGQLPIAVGGVAVQPGSSSFSADFGRVANETVFEVNLTPATLYAIGYRVTVLAKDRYSGEDITWEGDLQEPFDPVVLFSDFAGPFTVTIEPTGRIPDGGSTWTGRITINDFVPVERYSG